MPFNDCPATEYLRSTVVRGRRLLAALSLVLVYQLLAFPWDYSVSLLYVLLFFLAGLLFRAPRWLLYLVLLGALALQLRYDTQIVSRQTAYEVSTRDDAAEATAHALLRGQNPWNHVPELNGVPATTGPASVLVAVPFVALFGDINGLAFLFWLCFLGCLLASDVWRQNGTFPGLALIFLLGVFGIGPTLRWSLDELYFPMLWLVLAYGSILAGSWLLAGAALAAAILSRLDYLFLSLGFVGWLVVTRGSVTVRPWAWLAGGCLLGAALILAPFAIVGGQEFLLYNPLRGAAALSATPFPAQSHPVFALLNSVATALGPWSLRALKVGLIVALSLILGWWSRRSEWIHPFWHITILAFLAHTVGWFPTQLAMDYALIFVLPAMLAVAIDWPARPRLPQ